MSRVTIGDIAEDLLPFTEKGNKVIPIEIVPRKMVEMIIEKCDKEMEHCVEYAGNEYYDGRSDGVEIIKYFAESLLKQFEKGGE